jgi:phage virion morphogenesis protein
MGIKLTVNNFHIISNYMNQIKRKNKNIDPMLNDIGRYLVSETLIRFEKSEGPDGRKWKAIKRQGQILVDTGHLRESITYNIENNSLEIGSNLIYSAIHQLGGRTGRKHLSKIPARPYLGVNTNNRLEIQHKIINFIK